MRNSIAASSLFRCDGAEKVVLIGPGVLLRHRGNQLPARTQRCSHAGRLGRPSHWARDETVFRQILRAGCAQVPQAASEMSATRAPPASVSRLREAAKKVAGRPPDSGNLEAKSQIPGYPDRRDRIRPSVRLAGLSFRRRSQSSCENRRIGSLILASVLSPA